MLATQGTADTLLQVRRKRGVHEDPKSQDDVSNGWYPFVVVGRFFPSDLFRFHIDGQGRQHQLHGWSGAAVVHSTVVCLGRIFLSWRTTLGESIWPEALI